MGMTLRTVFGACCAMLPLLLGSAQAEIAMACATEEQRKLELGKLDKAIDWFLSIVEEVPEGIARQFRDIDFSDERTARRAIAHPLWRAHEIREGGAEIKGKLRPSWPGGHTPQEVRLKGAITALKASASFSVALSDYAGNDRGRRIIDVSDWTFQRVFLPLSIARYANCLVDDLVSSKVGSGPSTAPR
jgi:hypothetical protein